ncbi:hypothetical protein ACFT2C_04325 [Promicromonospora sp. NPDC057138]|uniref:hypothetical protein n=1 Tax=Promicromonospora sp. NPDC057138 TaxID=3346031 RepID=UPI003638891B
MNGPATDDASGSRPSHEAGTASPHESRLLQVGIFLRRIAAIRDVSARCGVLVGMTSLEPSGVEQGTVRVVEAHLQVPDPTDARFLAAVLWPAAVEPRIAERWVWRGWIVGDSPHTPLSITLSSDLDATLTTPGGSE